MIKACINVNLLQGDTEKSQLVSRKDCSYCWGASDKPLPHSLNTCNQVRHMQHMGLRIRFFTTFLGKDKKQKVVLPPSVLFTWECSWPIGSFPFFLSTNHKRLSLHLPLFLFKTDAPASHRYAIQSLTLKGPSVRLKLSCLRGEQVFIILEKPNCKSGNVQQKGTR